MLMQKSLWHVNARTLELVCWLETYVLVIWGTYRPAVWERYT